MIRLVIIAIIFLIVFVSAVIVIHSMLQDISSKPKKVKPKTAVDIERENLRKKLNDD